jgi:putative DNA primase/helicase
MDSSLKAVVDNYERENDLVLQFLEARCVRSETAQIKTKDIYSSFRMWAKSEGAYVLSARKFNSEMERHPEWFIGKVTENGYNWYKGIKLKEVI